MTAGDQAGADGGLDQGRTDEDVEGVSRGKGGEGCGRRMEQQVLRPRGRKAASLFGKQKDKWPEGVRKRALGGEVRGIGRGQSP